MEEAKGNLLTGTVNIPDRLTIGYADLGATAAGGTITANFATKSAYRAAPVGAATLAVSGLAEGQDGQVNLVYATGAITFTGVDWWDQGDGTVTAVFGSTPTGGTGLQAGGVYQFIFTRGEGATVGRVGRIK